MAGTLYIVATPIGNLEDITFRALKTLKEVDLILAEDTRETKKILNNFQIKKILLSLHQHSGLQRYNYILSLLNEGKNLALVSEAGTPGISDPGNKLISYLLSQNKEIKVVPIPGACALVTALSISGFPSDRFIFLGFIPRKKKRKKFLEEIIKADKTVVFYESTYRIVKTLTELKDFEKVFVNPPSASWRSGKKIMVARELTKKFETIYRGELREVIEEIKKHPLKGEFVVVVSN